MPASLPHRRRRFSLAIALVVMMMAFPCAAPAQESGPRAAVPPGQGPTMQEATSRPARWPTASSAAAEEPADNHVLSSIRPVPGAPLEPIGAMIAGEIDRAVAGASGVTQASFDSPTASPTDAPPVAQPAYQSLETALVVARVGPEVVLESDLLTPKALEWLEKTTPGMPPERVRELRLQICQQVLPQHIETLLLYVDACREIPADKLPEIRKNVDRAFDEQQLPRLMKEAGSPNSMEFEKSLRARGMSLDRMRKMFFERGLSQEWLRKNVKTDAEIPHAELIAWYQNHLADYDYPAKARFEAITVKMGLKRSKQQAWELIAAMGNEILAGRPFADVARERSEGPTASTGGEFDWTGRGSLASAKLDEAIFSLPVAELSAIIEDGEQLHIVRVVDREEAGRTSFVEAQVDIRETLMAERQRHAADEYLAKLRQRTPVWTVFDAEAGSAVEPQFTAGRPAAGTTR